MTASYFQAMMEDNCHYGQERGRSNGFIPVHACAVQGGTAKADFPLNNASRT